MPTKLLKSDKEKIPISPTTEYMAGGVLYPGIGFFGTNGTTISSLGDEITRCYGIRIYDQMMKDSRISKCINILKVSTIGDGVEISPSVADTSPDYHKALKVSDFCSYAIKNLKTPFSRTLYQLLDALVYGNKIAEITYALKSVPELDDKKYLLPEYIKTKPNRQISFVIDRYLNIIGFIGNTGFGLEKNLVSAEYPTSIKSEGAKVKNGTTYITISGEEYEFVERDKFMVLTLGMKDEDPRGTSSLIGAINAWHMKQQIFPEHLRFLLTCSIPLLIGFTPEDDPANPASVQILRNADGSPILDANGKPIPVQREAALRDALVQARNATAVALKGGSDVKEVGGKGSGVAFTKAIEIYDEQIESAILLNTLATSEGRYQNRAASQTHMTVLDQVVYWLKTCLVDVIKDDFLKKIIRYNLGEEALVYLPHVSLGDTERRNFVDEANSISALYKSGFLTQEQLRYLDIQLGIPPRTSNSTLPANINPIPGTPGNGNPTGSTE